MEIHLRTVVVDCEDAHRAAHFYSKLLGWPITLEEPDRTAFFEGIRRAVREAGDRIEYRDRVRLTLARRPR